METGRNIHKTNQRQILLNHLNEKFVLLCPQIQLSFFVTENCKSEIRMIFIMKFYYKRKNNFFFERFETIRYKERCHNIAKSKWPKALKV